MNSGKGLTVFSEKSTNREANLSDYMEKTSQVIHTYLASTDSKDESAKRCLDFLLNPHKLNQPNFHLSLFMKAMEAQITSYLTY